MHARKGHRHTRERELTRLKKESPATGVPSGMGISLLILSLLKLT